MLLEPLFNELAHVIFDLCVWSGNEHIFYFSLFNSLIEPYRVTSVYEDGSQPINGPCHDKTCLRGFRQSEIQISLLSYRH